MNGRSQVQYVPDRVTLVAAGVKQPRHAGYTAREIEEEPPPFKLKVWHLAAGLALVLIGAGLLLQHWPLR